MSLPTLLECTSTRFSFFLRRRTWGSGWGCRRREAPWGPLNAMRSLRRTRKRPEHGWPDRGDTPTPAPCPAARDTAARDTAARDTAAPARAPAVPGPRGAPRIVTRTPGRGTDPLDSALARLGLRRRFILCDGAELARLWARIGSGESEELTWVPQDEDESRARPAGFRALAGGLSSESLLNLEPKVGDDFVVVTEAAPFARAALSAIADALPGSPVLLMSDRIAPEEVPPYACLRHTGLRSLIRDDVERELDHLENLRRVVQLRELLEPREKVAILLQPDPDPDGIAAGLGVRALLGRKSPTAPLVSFGEVTRPENRAMVEALGIEVRTHDAGRARGVRRPRAGRRAAARLRREPARARAVDRRGDRPPSRAARLRRRAEGHPHRLRRDVVDRDRVPRGRGPRAPAQARHGAPLRHQERHAAPRPRHEPRRSRGVRARARARTAPRCCAASSAPRCRRRGSTRSAARSRARASRTASICSCSAACART